MLFYRKDTVILNLKGRRIAVAGYDLKVRIGRYRYSKCRDGRVIACRKVLSSRQQFPDFMLGKLLIAGFREETACRFHGMECGRAFADKTKKTFIM